MVVHSIIVLLAFFAAIIAAYNAFEFLSYGPNALPSPPFKVRQMLFFMSFGLDFYGLIFIAITALLWLIATVYSIGYMFVNYQNKSNLAEFFIFFHLSIFATFCLAFSQNLLTMFVFYEFLTFTTIPLILFNNTQESYNAIKKYLVILFGTSIGIAMPVIFYLYINLGDVNFYTLDLFREYAGLIPIWLVLALLVFGFAKHAMFPVHSWLPAAMIAPTPVSALLHAVAVVNVGIFCIIRITNTIFSIDDLANMQITMPFYSGYLLNFIAAFTIVFAAIKASYQTNLKMRLAYSTVSQLSYIILVILGFSYDTTLAGFIQMFAHSLSKIALFFCVGILYTKYHLTNVQQLNGLAKNNQLLFVCFLYAGLSLIGMPFTFGFTGKFFMIESLQHLNNWFTVFMLICSTFLTAYYMMPLFYRAIFLRASQNLTCNLHKYGIYFRAMFIALLGVNILNFIMFILYKDLIH